MISLNCDELKFSRQLGILDQEKISCLKLKLLGCDESILSFLVQLDQLGACRFGKGRVVVEKKPDITFKINLMKGFTSINGSPDWNKVADHFCEKGLNVQFNSIGDETSLILKNINQKFEDEKCDYFLIHGAGSAVLTANLGSDNNYNSGSITTNVTVEKANQTISIGALPENQPLKDFNSIPLSASSSSNAPIVASLAQGSAASLSGGVGSYSLVSIQQTGIVTITFTTDDSNNPNYKTVSTTLSINVVKSNQSVSYSNNPPSQITYSENLSITLGASASSGLAPEYAIVSGDNASLTLDQSQL